MRVGIDSLRVLGELIARMKTFSMLWCAIGILSMSACAASQMPVTLVTSSLTQAGEEITSSAGGFESRLVVYSRAQEALASDSYEEAKGVLEEFVAVSDAITGPLARAAARADNIETMRERFKPLSEFIAALDLPQGYARAYCPMYDGGSSWVQRDGPVRNPYYGSVMLTCGVIDAAPGAHMDHTPRHGGTVFMAPDSFHHIEGTYGEVGSFRIYATDNYREPVGLNGWTGRVVLEEEYNEETDEFVAIREVELVPSPDGNFLEADVGGTPVPAELSARVVFVEDFPEERFDFIFAELSIDGGGAYTTAEAGSGMAPLISDAPESIPLSERIRPAIPEVTADIVSGIADLNQQLQELIGRGAFTEIFIPALQAKELALALSDRAESLPNRARNDVRIAVRHLVRAAWLLDWYGDLGNKQQVSGAYDVFESSVSDISRVYEVAP